MKPCLGVGASHSDGRLGNPGTRATLSLQAGVHVSIVSERLRHSSVRIVLDT